MELFSLLAKLTLDANDFYKELDTAQKDADNFEDPSTPKLELDNDDFNTELGESEALGQGFGKNMEGVFNDIKSALTVTGIVGAIAGIVSGLKEAVDMTAETADGIDKGSKQLGISTKSYQQWDHALRQSGASIQDVKKGLINMQLALKAVDPSTAFDVDDVEDQIDGIADKAVGLSSDAYEALRDLGLLERLRSQEFSNAEELMDASLKALASFEGSKEDRGIIVRKLFGKGGDTLNAMLDEGYEGVQALLDEADKLGLVMSDEEIKNAVAYGDAVENLNAELAAIKQAFVADIIPVLTDCVGWLTDFLTKLNPRLQKSSIFDVFSQIDAKALIASTKVDEANATAKDLIEKLQQMGDYWSLDEEGRMTWDALADKALDLFPQLSTYIDKDGHKISDNTKAIEANIDAWSRLEKQRILSSAMDEKREAVAQQLVDAYSKGAEASEKESEAMGKQAVAMQQVNDALAKNEELRDAIQGAFGTTEVTKENAADILSFIRENGFQTTDMGALDEWVALNSQAESLRTEADKMISEAETANKGLVEYEERLGKEMGLTQDEIAESTDAVKKYKLELNGIPRRIITKFIQEDERAFGHAIGSAYIPYDNYPALLHRGEKVLTATEARQGGSSGVDFSAMEDRIVAAIRQGMDGATVRSYLNGREITAEVNRNNINDVKGRRFST